MPIQTQNDDSLLSVLTEIRNWLRAAAHKPVQAMLEEALPDAKTRTAYQMFDGTKSVEQVRIACKLSPNAVVAMTLRCVSMGLMEAKADKRRVRLFDLNDFGLLPEGGIKSGGNGDER
ncbi:MAG: hypothetical protein IPL75_03195 [Acidobacteria bacterium]|nr:hypothetical protein [Acidobacteriota bacterium]